MLWVMKITVLRSRCQSSSNSSCKSWRVWASTAPKGSSISRIVGFTASARQTGALLHAAGKLVRVVVFEIRQTDAPEIIARRTGALFSGQLAQLQAEFHVGQ